MHFLTSFSTLIASAAATTSFFDGIGSRRVDWNQCPPLNPGVALLECAELQVPLDYDHPSRENITLGIARHLARDQKNRIGALFYNPGGPGDIVTDQLAGGILEDGFQAQILDRFDLIAVDLRGSGRSTPLKCDMNLYEAIAGNGSSFLSSSGMFQKAQETNKKFRKSCMEQSSNSRLIDFMDTISIAKDYEYVRRAIGNEKITFFGQSYGTQLATQYAEMFSHALRGVLLDATVDRSQDPASELAQNAASMDAVLKYFFAWCKAQNATVCPAAHTSPKQPLEQTWNKLMAKAAELGPSYPSLVRGAIRSTLYSQITWPKLALQIYQAVFENNKSSFGGAASPDPGANSAYNRSADTSFVAISCADRPGESSAVSARLKQDIAISEAPLMAGVTTSLLFLSDCAGWPFPKRNPPHKLQIPRTNKDLKFLMVTTLYDPAAPTVFTQSIQSQIGADRAPIILRRRGGHTTYFKSEARDGPTVAAMNRFLVTLDTPPSGTEFDN